MRKFSLPSPDIVRTRSQINPEFLFHRVHNILTACRFLQISISSRTFILFHFYASFKPLLFLEILLLMLKQNFYPTAAYIFIYLFIYLYLSDSNSSSRWSKSNSLWHTFHFSNLSRSNPCTNTSFTITAEENFNRFGNNLYFQFYVTHWHIFRRNISYNNMLNNAMLWSNNNNNMLWRWC